MTDTDSKDTLERLIDLGHLSSGIGHHVINAFSAIVSNAELLRLERPMATVASPVTLAETIIKTALDASTVARRLIDYTRSVTSIEPNRAAFHPDTLDLAELVAQTVDEERAIARPEIRWETDFAAIYPMKGHRVQLRSMLVHILTNAYEALPPEGGTIYVSTSTDNRGWLVLEVRDTGRGMDTPTLERASEPSSAPSRATSASA